MILYKVLIWLFMEQSIMKDSKKYFKDINKLFPIHSTKEKKYLHDLKKQIDEYDELSYHELEEQFGTPIDIVVAYYETIDTKYILKKIKIKHIISTICVLIMLLVAVTSCYEIYTVNQAKKKFDEMWPIHYEEKITEDKEITE